MTPHLMVNSGKLFLPANTKMIYTMAQHLITNEMNVWFLFGNVMSTKLNKNSNRQKIHINRILQEYETMLFSNGNTSELQRLCSWVHRQVWWCTIAHDKNGHELLPKVKCINLNLRFYHLTTVSSSTSSVIFIFPLFDNDDVFQGCERPQTKKLWKLLKTLKNNAKSK